MQSLIDHPYAWIIQGPDLLGSVRLDRVDLKRRASFAIGMLRSEYLGKGLGTEAARKALRYVFSDLGLHRIPLRVRAINERVIRSYQKCGFKMRARARNGSSRWQMA